MEKLVKSVVTGKRIVMGTEMAIESFVEKDSRGWLLTKGLFNGVPSGSERFKTKKAALEALADYTGTEI